MIRDNTLIGDISPMFKKVLTMIAMFTAAGHATGAIQAVIAPQDWLLSTNSSAEIHVFLNQDQKDNKMTYNNYSESVMDTLNRYKDMSLGVISAAIPTKDISSDSGAVCKISFTADKSDPSIPSQPEVLLLDFLADNTSEGCKKITKVLTKAVKENKDMEYPVSLKKEGLLSIDMIYFFN
jgi:hypothetical protein